MKQLKILFFILFVVVLPGYGQNLTSIDSVFQKQNSIAPTYFLFAPAELIRLCNDSVGRKKFLKSIDRYVKKVKSNSPEEKEMKVLLTLIRNQVKAVRLEKEQYIQNRLFIETTLNPYLIDFKVSEDFVRKRFSTDSDLTDCSSCLSMYVFLVYDPLLYIKVRTTEKGFENGRSHFPLAYTLQNCDIPLDIRIRMKEGLLMILSSHKEPLLVKISKETDSCKLDFSCN